MSAQDRDKEQCSAAVRAEAAAWVARLHGPNRSREVEAGLRRWLADDPEHAAAFELVTDTWEKSARLRRRPMEAVVSWERVGFRLNFSRAALATAVIVAIAVVTTSLYLRNDALASGIGELRTLTLDDGTRVHLNTDTRIRVRYDEHLRRVSLERGEALFEVAKQPQRPFVVTAGGRQITALGTAFVVRQDDRNLAVTLVEGKITVAPVAPRQETGPSAPPSDPPIVLSPGQRLTFSKAQAAKIDRPALEQVTAWQHGQVSFDDTPLADAAADMNRYSRQRIVIEEPAVAAIRVSGIFAAGDSLNFVQALASTYGLRVQQTSDTLVLAASMKVNGE